MGHPAIKIETASGTDLQSPGTPRSLDPRIAPAQVRTLPPPPPLAAFALRLPEEPAARTLSTPPVARASLPPLPEAPPLPLEERFELDLSPNPRFAAALSQPPRARKTPWLRSAATAIGAAALLSIGYLAATLRTPVSVAATAARPSPIADHASERTAEREAVAAAVADTPAKRLEQVPLVATLDAVPAANSVASVPRSSNTTWAAAARSSGAAERRALNAPRATPEPTKPESARIVITPRVDDGEPHSHDAQANDSPAQAVGQLASQREPNTPHVPAPAASVTHTALTRDPVAELPAQPTRDQVKQSLQQIEPAVLACSAGAHGMVFANVTVASSGRVSHGTIEGAFAGTPQGSCMARALRTASFPEFSAQSFSVKYPFRL